MTGWIIAGSILLVLILIFAQSIKVTAIYDKNPELRVKILFFTLVKVPPDPEKLKKKAEKAAKKEEKRRRKEARSAAKEARKHPNYNHAPLRDTSPEAQAEGEASEADRPKEAESAPEADKKSASFAGKHPKKKMKLPSIEMIRDYIASASPPIKRLFKKIRIRDVYIDYVVGSNDAAKTALKYGGISAAIYSLTEFFKTYMDTKVGEINIEADFTAEKDDIFAYVNVKLRISTAVGCALWLGVRVLKTYLKYNKTEKPKAKPKRAAAI